MLGTILQLQGKQDRSQGAIQQGAANRSALRCRRQQPGVDQRQQQRKSRCRLPARADRQGAAAQPPRGRRHARLDLLQQGPVVHGDRIVPQQHDEQPDNPGYNYHLARALQKNGNTEEARKLLEKAVSSKSDFENAEEAKSFWRSSRGRTDRYGTAGPLTAFPLRAVHARCAWAALIIFIAYGSWGVTTDVAHGWAPLTVSLPDRAKRPAVCAVRHPRCAQPHRTTSPARRSCRRRRHRDPRKLRRGIRTAYMADRTASLVDVMAAAGGAAIGAAGGRCRCALRRAASAAPPLRRPMAITGRWPSCWP